MNDLINIFMNVVKNNYANFDGRARRREYWMFQLAVIIAAVAVSIVGGILGFVADFLGTIVFGVFGLAILAIIVPAIALTIRRLHDTNKSGWFILVSFIPLVGIFILLYFMIVEGDKGVNQYGEDPKAGE